jgi:hypothetical protein
MAEFLKAGWSPSLGLSTESLGGFPEANNPLRTEEVSLSSKKDDGSSEAAVLAAVGSAFSSGFLCIAEEDCDLESETEALDSMERWLLTGVSRPC